MQFYFTEFIRGLNDGLTKTADSIFDIQGAMFPALTSQASWKYNKTDDHLHLHDGNNVYSFHFPSGEHETEDFPAVKQENVQHHTFDHDNARTAQIHRADPGSIYFTLQDGHQNPTYTIKHVTEDQWRVSPKVKVAVASDVDIASFVKGASDSLPVSIINQLMYGADAASRGAIRGTMALGHDPGLSAAAGLLGGASYDLAKRTLYNTPKENEQETAGERLRRYLVPAAGAGILGSAEKSLFPNYYSEFPLHRP